MRQPEFLNWIADRLVHVYGESPNVDFVLRLRQIANTMREDQTNWPSERIDREAKRQEGMLRGEPQGIAVYGTSLTAKGTPALAIKPDATGKFEGD